MAAFWDLTPRETWQSIEAAAWRLRQEQRLALTVAWHQAALQRSRRMPALEKLLAGLEERRPLTAAEAHERRDEFADMRARMGAGNGGRGHTARRGTDPGSGDAR